MAEDSLQRASFVRTDENGLLEFRVDDGRLICVEVTDELERGIIESKQIVAELKGAPSPHSEKALPISTIQTLLRAGEDPADVAKEYNIGEPLVRRFAKPVEIEKRYQIDQFRHSHMPGSPVIHETVESSLQAQLLQSGVRFTDVSWNATRHGRDPWRIQASFPQSGRTYTAEWSFDTIHGTIICLDQVSKRLFSRTQASAPAEETVPVAAQTVPAPADSPAPADTTPATAQQKSDPAAQVAAGAEGVVRRSGRVAAADAAAESAGMAPSADAGATSAAADAADDAQTERIPAARDDAQGAAASPAAHGSRPADGSASTLRQEQPAQPKKQRPVFRKWDDIIFGE